MTNDSLNELMLRKQFNKWIAALNPDQLEAIAHPDCYTIPESFYEPFTVGDETRQFDSMGRITVTRNGEQVFYGPACFYWRKP